MFNGILEVFSSHTGPCTLIERAQGMIDTSLFGCYDGGIWGILLIVLNVMIVCVGALAILGLVISGIQYSTAAGDTAKMTKAKKRK